MPSHRKYLITSLQRRIPVPHDRDDKLMHAMILAAGRGERMRPLTDKVPKPLLQVGGKPLIEYHIEGLADAGFRDLVINHAYLGQQIEQAVGDGERWGVSVTYVAEPPGALETGGGIYNALSLLGEQPFVVVNADIWTRFPFRDLPQDPEGLAHLVLVDNPPQHAEGDFVLAQGKVSESGHPRLTFSGIGVYRHALFSGCRAGRFPLAPLLRQAMSTQAVTGEYFAGEWCDIGTPQRLTELDQLLASAAGSG